MPELPEVETIKNAIEKSIGNAEIMDVVIRNFRFREKVPEDFAQNVKHSKIISYQRIAKYMVINLDNGNSIIWHLGMSGKVKIVSKLPEIFEKHDHIILETNNGIIIYNDARRFGLITHTETINIKEHHLLSKIGLDPFDKELNGKYLFQKLQAKRIPIKVALLDQTIINGIGNIYASEILYISKILPTRNSDDISLKECESIVKATREVLEKAISAGGSTLKDYQKPDGSMGYFQNLHCVYNKTGQRCSKCSCDIKTTGGIKKIVQAGRSTFYCPVKQK